MIWATRPRIHVDRAASAWLISRYVDPVAEFVYIDDLDDLPNGAIAFDMVGAELTHVGVDITFETILRRYDLDDPVLWRLAQIIHQADVEDDLFDAPEAAGIDAVIRALSADHGDETVRQLTGTIFSSMYNYLREQV